MLYSLETDDEDKIPPRFYNMERKDAVTCVLKSVSTKRTCHHTRMGRISTYDFLWTCRRKQFPFSLTTFTKY
jgi:hypothetical protein